MIFHGITEICRTGVSANPGFTYIKKKLNLAILFNFIKIYKMCMTFLELIFRINLLF